MSKLAVGNDPPSPPTTSSATGQLPPGDSAAADAKRREGTPGHSLYAEFGVSPNSRPAEPPECVSWLQHTPAAQSIVRPPRLSMERTPGFLSRRLGCALLTLRRLVGATGPVVRRAVDVTAGMVGLTALAPLLLLLAVAIRIDSRGAILFRQQRVGKNGGEFAMFKLRTMTVDAEKRKAAVAAAADEEFDQVRFKLKNDPRVTAVGKYLRRYSLDELPQLWNLVRGDMTLIGPRPPLPNEVAEYSPHAARRLEVRPGLTCYWQVRGRSHLCFDTQVDYDLEYIDSAGLVDELKILGATIPAVLSGRGAY